MLKDRTLTAPPIVRTPDDFDSLSSFIILRENENDQISLRSDSFRWYRVSALSAVLQVIIKFSPTRDILSHKMRSKKNNHYNS